MAKDKATIAEDEVLEKDELQKSLDDNLAALDATLKSGTETSIDDMLKSKSARKKIKAKLDEYEEDDDNEDEDEDEGSDDDEDEDKEEAASKKKMKKSLKDVVEANEEVIDAVPVLKSFVDLFKSFIDEVAELRKANVENTTIVKSLSSTIVAEGAMLKSINEEIHNIGEMPTPVKGKVSKEDILEKSFSDEVTKEVDMLKSLPVSRIQDELLAGHSEGSISANAVSKYELSGYNLAAMPVKDLNALRARISKGGR